MQFKIMCLGLLLMAVSCNAYQKICKPIGQTTKPEEIEKDHKLAYSFIMTADKSPDRVGRTCEVYLTAADIQKVKKDLGSYSSDDEITLEMIQTVNPETSTGKILADYRGFEVVKGAKTLAPVYQMVTRL